MAVDRSPERLLAHGRGTLTEIFFSIISVRVQFREPEFFAGSPDFICKDFTLMTMLKFGRNENLETENSAKFSLTPGKKPLNPSLSNSPKTLIIQRQLVGLLAWFLRKNKN